ncbi:hypothetical protein HBI56_194120 [Parastagonospora nodorum]|uniref:Heterokaryon incompatibility domain-containing protein n=1 Tax=Phaeosphaeria nodorum (strain SN15 / ATCC MYA-4574 / FGSC 10173) TaxID=321614 RepID=A0A7U2EZG3_PHANO|nr:hypothetical protein HBH56_205770 [Parastagonospora nodorum]QRC94758.1 hypothetical protein JI435_149060 [Parastagonospora nodorum SN15]KAH3923744.1 hypothetical protein HBH54_204640 [Parastagonospora nodorum]KAH3942247.1 hypothetical protein HBH53_189710 [Parastagonospora nodorum]KAH3962326.1 hypothetical protein HBH51_176070 [Parastagonospora nodorum]
MRLINAATLQLERFDDDTRIPPYAILSHTWAAEEVTLQHFEDAYTGDETTGTRIRLMLGYAKILKACYQTLQDSYAYVWVDTCCIDKTSSAELSEAINSMFRWYENAQVCYAYLEDIEAHATEDPNIYQSEASAVFDTPLKTAKWFTRGWTLQEMIASTQLKFYSSDWTFLGTKETLLEELTNITKVDRLGLTDFRPEHFSVAQRMSWAANRRTVRTEDIAYSLMGIFDVNMPLLYGEGEKAFARLQEAILNSSEDQSLFAWSPSIRTDMPPGKGTFFFAQHPREFVASRGILHTLPSGGEPTALTSKGIRINLPIQKIKNSKSDLANEAPLFLAVLYCIYKEKPDHLPAIVLRRSQTEADTDTDTQAYVRHESEPIRMVHVSAVSRSSIRQVYLRRRAPTPAVARATLRTSYFKPRR